MRSEPTPLIAGPPGGPAGEVYWARPLMVAAMVAIAAQLGQRSLPTESSNPAKEQLHRA